MMKNRKYIYFFLLSAVFCLTACSQWDDHYRESSASSTETVEVFRGSAADFLKSQTSLSSMVDIYESSFLMTHLAHDVCLTAIVCEDGCMGGNAQAIVSADGFAANSLSTLSVSPMKLVSGQGIYMRSGKNLWVSVDTDGRIFLNEQQIVRMVKVDNGYVYFVDGPIPVQPSVYEYICSLGDDYSLFRQFVKEFEESYFDEAASTPGGVDEMGNRVYTDSVMSLRNVLMDRYTEGGQLQWNMFSESFLSTLFIPDNTLLKAAYENALDSIPVWMNRSATSQDSLKFRQWIVSSCFVDRRLNPEDVAPTAEGQFDCVGGYVREVDRSKDVISYVAEEAAQWKPSVQLADWEHPVSLSNGRAYHLKSFKIPNHIVIWRVKARLYQVWAALNAEQSGWNATSRTATDGGYFRWNHLTDPMQVSEAQGPFELSSTLPVMYYHVLTAVPDLESRHSAASVSVDYDGLLYNADEPKTFGLNEVRLPAGEYYLRMGFKHSLKYSISIYFCEEDEQFGPENCLVEDMSLIATGSNFHFDRGGAMEGLDFYGSESIGYPEYFDWRWWYDQDPEQYQKASAYDTDGYQVAIVNLKKSGNFKIRIESSDMAELYYAAYGDDLSTNIRTKSNVQQLMMYHWCLRPTRNNY